MKNLITAALFALIFFASAASAQTVKVIVPHGITVEVETLPAETPPPEPTPDPLPPVPAQTPHWHVTAAMSQGGGIDADGNKIYGVNAARHTAKDVHQTHAETAAAVGSSCTTWIRRNWPENPGIVVAHAGGSKHCHALPKDGAAAWLYELGAGIHPQPVNFYSRMPWIVQGVLSETGDKLTTIDCIYDNMTGGDKAQRSTNCVGGRFAHDLTVRNINVVLAKYDDKGTLLTTGLANNSFRCIGPGDGHLLVENVTLSGCKNGIQGPDGKTWTLRNVRIEDANFKGTLGKYHGVYTPVIDELRIEDSYIHSRAGYPVKSQARKTVIRRTTLVEGGGNTGAAVQTHGGALEMTDVILIQPPSKGSARIFHIGGRNGTRCIGNQPVTLTRVEIIDNDPSGVSQQRFLNTCGRTEFKDGGGNTYSHMGGPARNLFKDGRVNLKGVQP